MSIKVMSDLWENSQQKGSSLLLLMAIADHADDKGRAYPSIDRLAKKTRMSRRNVQLLCVKLCEEGELKVEENAGPHGCNVYFIKVKEGGEKISPVKNSGTEFHGGGEKLGPGISPEPSGTVKNHKELSDYSAFVEFWMKEIPGYVFGGREGKLLKGLLKATRKTGDELIDLVRAAWRVTDTKRGWNCVHRSKTIPNLASAYNAIVLELNVLDPPKPKLPDVPLEFHPTDDEHFRLKWAGQEEE